MTIVNQLNPYYKYVDGDCHVFTMDRKLYLVFYILRFNFSFCWKYSN